MESYTLTQKQRLTELNAPEEYVEAEFETAEERNESYRKLEKYLVREGRKGIAELLSEKRICEADRVGGKLCAWLKEIGYTKVLTPTIIHKDAVKKMTIGEDHDLFEQIFWLPGNRCLRPMLAPGLYVVMRELHRITNGPVRIFELGSCFRKESQGAQHMNEFTMLNMVQLAACEEGEQLDVLKRMARGAMEALEVPEERYELVIEESTVYGHTLDIEIDGIEVASGSYGPHFLDKNWDVHNTWVGIGFGIERLCMALAGARTIKRYGRSIAFIDGKPLKL